MADEKISEETLLVYVSTYFSCSKEMAQILILSAKNNDTLKELESTVKG